jgi:GNAT superfamily N-acetyltransferase
LPAPNNLTARTGYVQWIATDHDARRRGFGRAVMDAIVAWCDEQRLTAIELHATSDGEPLYRQVGFDDGPHPALRIRRR